MISISYLLLKAYRKAANKDNHNLFPKQIIN